MGMPKQLSLVFDDGEQPLPVTSGQPMPSLATPTAAPENPEVPSLITSGVIAAMLSDERHRVKRILATRTDLRPVAVAGRTRLYRPRSRDDMADWLGIGIATLDRMTKAGEIPSMLLNKRRGYVPAHVIAAKSVCVNVKAKAPPGD